MYVRIYVFDFGMCGNLFGFGLFLLWSQYAVQESYNLICNCLVEVFIILYLHLFFFVSLAESKTVANVC